MTPRQSRQYDTFLSRLSGGNNEVHFSECLSPLELGVEVPRTNIDDDPQLGEMFWAQTGVQSSMAQVGELAWA